MYTLRKFSLKPINYIHLIYINIFPIYFINHVNALIKEGWRPQGGVGLNPHTGLYFQAMVR